MIRCINAWLGAAAVALFTIHGITMGLFLAGYLDYSPTRKYWGYALLICIILHGVISLMLVIFADGKRKSFVYFKENRKTHLQRILGIIGAVLICHHMVAYGYVNAAGVYILKEPSFTTFITEAAMAVVLGAHIVLSLPKAAITLGMIKTQKEIKLQTNLAYILFFMVESIVLYGLCSYFL
ncbi:hypothetical protein [Aminipila terrae]|uniref:Pilus assembly protein PilX n=1 Tax=Aminipila terrae TaxID=2697030 RepID=A0A6P1MM77_9FIRM|nr:hypothetical protein [Aminipila terrae]QHI72746.1 hypothetical protein Ami3637_10330 [Aminipila terrae]